MSKQVTLMTDAIPYQEFAKLIGKSTGAVRRMIDKGKLPVIDMFNDEWWTHQLKGQRMRWHEALLIAVGEVNKDRSPYASKHARGALKYGLRTPNRQQRNGSPLKPHEIAPSARLTRSERMQITRVRVDLAQNGIRPQRWELEALARGATVNYDGKTFTYPVADEWPGYSTEMEWS